MRRKFYYTILFLLLDFLSASLAWIFFYSLRKKILFEAPEPLNISIISDAAIIGIFWLVLYFINGNYNGDIYRKSRLRETIMITRITLIGSVILFFSLLLDDEGVVSYKFYYKTFGLLIAVHFSFLFISKIFLITILQKLIKKGRIKFNTLIIGSGEKAKSIYKEIIESNKHLGLNIIGFVHVFEEMSNGNGLSKIITHFGGIKAISKAISENNIEEVIIAVEPSEHKKIEEILTVLDDHNVRIRIIIDLYQILIGSVKVNNLLGTPLTEINRSLMPTWQFYVKRIFDITIATIVLIICFPLFIFIGIMVKLSSQGSILFKQKRLGLHGKPFNILKFRSMYTDAEKDGPLLSSKNDERITRWGRTMRKTRIDELPQFWNVLIGDMSIVGPRPEREFYKNQIMEKAPYYKNIHKVRPGITSYGMVKFGYAENVDEMIERLKYDILYIENMSLAMDFRILLYTILIILQGKGK